MPEVATSEEFSTPAERVWELIAGFDTLPDYHSSIAKSALSKGGVQRELTRPASSATASSSSSIARSRLPTIKPVSASRKRHPRHVECTGEARSTPSVRPMTKLRKPRAPSTGDPTTGFGAPSGSECARKKSDPCPRGLPV